MTIDSNATLQMALQQIHSDVVEALDLLDDADVVPLAVTAEVLDAIGRLGLVLADLANAGGPAP